MRCAFKQHLNKHQIHYRVINAVLMTFVEKKSINLNSKPGCPNLHGLKINKQYLKLITTASEVYTDFISILFHSKSFLIKLKDILKNNILTCSCWASIENGLLRSYASQLSLLYSGFRYTIERPLQPYKIQLYTF